MSSMDSGHGPKAIIISCGHRFPALAVNDIRRRFLAIDAHDAVSLSGPRMMDARLALLEVNKVLEEESTNTFIVFVHEDCRFAQDHKYCGMAIFQALTVKYPGAQILLFISQREHAKAGKVFWAPKLYQHANADDFAALATVEGLKFKKVNRRRHEPKILKPVSQGAP